MIIRKWIKYKRIYWNIMNLERCLHRTYSKRMQALKNLLWTFIKPFYLVWWRQAFNWFSYSRLPISDASSQFELKTRLDQTLERHGAPTAMAYSSLDGRKASSDSNWERMPISWLARWHDHQGRGISGGWWNYSGLRLTLWRNESDRRKTLLDSGSTSRAQAHVWI